MAAPHPQLTFINLPGPPSNPDTPSEMPGTPTSTTTSLSALSTTAIKDGHRGHALPTTTHRAGHHPQTSQGSIEAERADRISRLAGLSSVSQQLRHSGSQQQQQQQATYNNNNNASSPQTTPTSTTGFFQPQPVAPQIMGAPAYFDSNGQPVAVTKTSTVGTASATESSAGGRTTTEGESRGDDDIDMVSSTDTNYFREPTEADDRLPPHDEDAGRSSVGGFDDRMSDGDGDNDDDDGSASLVGFGEGANSTMSGPIYVRSRPLPGMMGGLERSSSGLSEGMAAGAAHRRGDSSSRVSGPAAADRETTDTPVSSTAAMERREAQLGGGGALVDLGPLPSGPVQPGQISALRETQPPQPHYTRQQASTARETAERLTK